MTEEIGELQKRIKSFIEARDWEKYHTPKSTAMSVAIEASELMEIFQWHDNLHAGKYDDEIMESVEEELADVVIYSLSLAEQFDIDLSEAILEKIEGNKQRFDLENIEEINQDLDQWMED